MSGRRLQRSKAMEARTPYPELPLPAKFQKIPKTPAIKLVPPPEPEPKPKPKPIGRRPKGNRPVKNIEILEPIVGGELEPEASRKKDKGDHVVEEIDYADYQ